VVAAIGYYMNRRKTIRICISSIVQSLFEGEYDAHPPRKASIAGS
jgi:hypothetical protein